MGILGMSAIAAGTGDKRSLAKGHGMVGMDFGKHVGGTG